jgi:hypothetical protein
MGGMPPEPQIDLFGQGPPDEPPPPPPPPPMELLAMLAEDEKPERQPTYPPDFEKPPRPDKAGIETLKTALDAEFLDYRDRVREHRELLRPGKMIAVLNKDEEPWYDSALVDEMKLVTNIVGGIDPSIDVPPASPELQEDVQRVEDALYQWREDAIRRYARRQRGSLPHHRVWYLCETGRVVTRCVLNPKRPNEPFDETLVDPATVRFVEGGDRGPTHVVRVYADTVGNVLADYGKANAGLRAKLLDGQADEQDSAATKLNGARRFQPRKLTDKVEVVEYWDTWYRCVIVDGRTAVGVTEHEYGRVPYVVTGSGIGGPGAALPDDGLDGTDTERAKYRDQSYIQDRVRSHAQREVVMSRFFTEFVKKPDWFLYQDDFAAEKGTRDVLTGDGGDNVNPALKDREAWQQIVTAPPQQVFGPLLAGMTQNQLTQSMPQSAYGVNQNSNVSGYALEGLNESGKDKLTPILMAMERHEEELDEMKLEFFRNFGHLVVDEHGVPSGELTIQRREPKAEQAPAFVLEPETIDRTGTRVVVKMTSLRLQNLPALYNAGRMGIELGVMTRTRLMELAGERNPQRMRDEWLYEQMMTHPDVQKMAMYKAAKEMADPEAAEFFLSLIQGSGNNGGGGPPPPGMPPPDPTGGLTTMSLPGLGMPPGMGSGPQGPYAPEPPMGGPPPMMPPGMMPPAGAY